MLEVLARCENITCAHFQRTYFSSACIRVSIHTQTNFTAWMQHENQAHIKVVKCQRKSRSNRSSSKKQQQLVVAVVVAAAAAVVVVVVTLQVFVQESYNLLTCITKIFS